MRLVETLGKIDGDGFSLDGAEALSLSPAVDCRIGSLENQRISTRHLLDVDCRIGSLETELVRFSRDAHVDCRIGSLEKKISECISIHRVDCRIGSLEILSRGGRSLVDC